MSASTPPGPPVTFAPATHSRAGKVQCSVCGRRGYDVDFPHSWKEICLRGHLPCAKGCGRLLAVLANGKPRSHPRCPGGEEW